MPLTVIEGPNRKGEWLLAGATVRMWVKAEALKPLPPETPGTGQTPAPTRFVPTRDVIELDLHGMRAQEARTVLVDTLDRALLDNANEIHVIHGLGAGTLRSVVMDFAKETPQVKRASAQISNPGVTVLYLG